MSFHTKQKIALSLHEQVIAANPALAKTADALKAHFLEGGLERPAPFELYAALLLLTTENFESAARTMSAKLTLHIMQAEKYVLDCVNNGPDFMKDEDALHEKGIMRGSRRYFLGNKGIHLGGTYDRAWHAVDRIYRPIVAEALQRAIGKTDKADHVPRNVMRYAAVLLMPADNRKLFELNKLSLKHSKHHGAFLQSAAQFIERTASDLGINVPEQLLSPARAILSAPVRPDFAPSHTAPKLRTDFVPRKQEPIATPQTIARMDKPMPQSEHASVDATSLRRYLSGLVNAGKISQRDANMFNWLYSESPTGAVRTISDVAERMRERKGDIRLKIATINGLLRKQGLSLNDDGHEPRAVRP